MTVAGEPEKDNRSPLKRMPILIGIAAVIVLAIAVGIWQLYSRRPTIEPASVEKMAFPLPEKPSIAVLPFDNLSGDEEALTVYNQLLDRSRKGEFPLLAAHLYLADTYAAFGKEEEARNHAAEVLKINPGFSLKEVEKITSFRYKDPAHLEHRLNALRKAGIPE